MKLWLWKNFVDGKPEYWAFDNPFPVHLYCGDPQTLGEPCGYAIFKESRAGRPDVPEAEVLRRIAAARDANLGRAVEPTHRGKCVSALEADLLEAKGYIEELDRENDRLRAANRARLIVA